jgi:hypothetical protein
MGDKCGDATGDDAGLAAARAGKDQQRSIDVVNGFLLRFRQLLG